MGPGGNCVCPKCGKTVPHKVGTPCYEVMCPDCGSPLTRQ
jgi:predicted amidophosphoribosyltransferase